MKKIFLISSFLSMCTFNHSYGREQKECIVEFKLNSSTEFLNTNEPDDCLSSLINKDIEAVTIIGSANKIGNQQRNNKLAKERAKTIGVIIQEKFPNAIINQISVGENEELGKKTKINFNLKEEKDQEKNAKIRNDIDLLEQRIQALEIESKEKGRIATNESFIAGQLNNNTNNNGENNKNSNSIFFNKNSNIRVSLRTGIDTTRIDSKRNYISSGGEISWQQDENNFRQEIGFRASTSIGRIELGGDSVNQVSNAYGFWGIGATINGWAGGGRFLLGGEWIDIANNFPQQYQMAVGGEARIGYEWKGGISLFASYGLTEHLQMIGIDLGMNI